MTYMTSTASNAGVVDITVYFKQGTDPDMAAVNVPVSYTHLDVYKRQMQWRTVFCSRSNCSFSISGRVRVSNSLCKYIAFPV